MVDNISTGLGTVSRVLAYGQIMAQYGTVEGDGPFDGVETDYVYRGVLGNFERNQRFREAEGLVVVLAVGQRGPVAGFVFPGESSKVGILLECVLPSLNQGKGRFGTRSLLLDTHGQFNTVVVGPQKMFLRKLWVVMVDDVL